MSNKTSWFDIINILRYQQNMQKNSMKTIVEGINKVSFRLYNYMYCIPLLWDTRLKSFKHNWMFFCRYIENKLLGPCLCTLQYIRQVTARLCSVNIAAIVGLNNFVVLYNLFQWWICYCIIVNKVQMVGIIVVHVLIVSIGVNLVCVEINVKCLHLIYYLSLR